MRHVELFAGIGGFRLGIDRAFGILSEPSETGRRQDIRHSTSFKEISSSPLPTCVFASEWDKFAAQTYNKNFGGQIDTRDITIIPNSDIPEHDLLTGGFPCQTFSIAGKRAGFNETRGTMFFEVARIVADKKPQHLVLENVKGLLSHDSGRTFQTILGVLADLGYRVEWQVLNSKHFGVPQNRERIYIIGHLGVCCGRQIFPILNSYQGVQRKNINAFPMQWRRTEEGKIYRHESMRQGSDKTPFGSNYRELVPKDSNQIGTITSQAIAKDSLILDHAKVRRLTPIECERLQSFPDNWTVGVSDNQRYKQTGNAVTVNVVEAVIRRLYL